MMFVCDYDDNNALREGRCLRFPVGSAGWTYNICCDLSTNNSHRHYHQQRRRNGHVSLLIIKLPLAPLCWLQAARWSWIIMFGHIYKTTRALGDTVWQTNLSNSNLKKVSAYTVIYKNEQREEDPTQAQPGLQFSGPSQLFDTTSNQNVPF